MCGLDTRFISMLSSTNNGAWKYSCPSNGLGHDMIWVSASTLVWTLSCPGAIVMQPTYLLFQNTLRIVGSVQVYKMLIFIHDLRHSMWPAGTSFGNKTLFELLPNLPAEFSPSVSKYRWPNLPHNGHKFSHKSITHITVSCILPSYIRKIDLCLALWHLCNYNRRHKGPKLKFSIHM